MHLFLFISLHSSFLVFLHIVISIQASLAASGLVDPPHLPYLVYAYGLDCFTRECAVGCNVKIMGYPF